MHAQRVRAREVDAFDLRRRHQARDVLRVGAPAHAFAQIVGDAGGDHLIGQHLPFMPAVEPNDMEAVTGRDRSFAQLHPARAPSQPVRTQALSARK